MRCHTKAGTLRGVTVSGIMDMSKKAPRIRWAPYRFPFGAPRSPSAPLMIEEARSSMAASEA